MTTPAKSWVPPANLGYLDSTSPLPTDQLELYFLLKRAIKHTIEIAHSVIKDRESVRSAIILARCALRVAVICEAIADVNPQKVEIILTCAPNDKLDYYFAMRDSVAELILMSRETTATIEGVRNAQALARNARHLHAVAKRLYEIDKPKEPPV